VIFHGAPAVIFITADKSNEWADIDIGMCAQNIMLAAKSLGYDSCPVGLAKAIDKTKVYSELKIPITEEVKLALAIGYAYEQPEIHKRNMDNIIFLN
jgi:nitroreductase